MDKPNARELLKEARDMLDAAEKHLGELIMRLPIGTFQIVDGELMQNLDYWKQEIDAYLAAPSESAMETVRKIREAHEDGSGDFAFDDSGAAALIEGLQRSVPSALFDEIIQIQPLSYAKLGRAFVKHGVRCEP